MYGRAAAAPVIVRTTGQVRRSQRGVRLSVSTENAAQSAPLRARVLHYLPRGNMLDEAEWKRRHHLLLWVLGLHVPGLVVFGLVMGWGAAIVGGIGGYILLLTVAGYLATQRRAASLLVTLGLTSCSVGLVILSDGSIEAHFHFFIIVGFLALYQDWFPFLWNIAFTVVSHGIGSALVPTLIFNHLSGQDHPWLWSLIHGVSVLAACVGVLIFWRFSEDVQNQRTELTRKLAQAEISKKEFTSELLLNLARRNQGMFHRQLDIINDLEEKERDPDALAELFRLDHLATRVRRNAESLLVLSGEQPARVWSAPVPLRDVVRAAIAETEDLERVVFTVDEHVSVAGSAVADLTHLLAELAENAVRFSPPTSSVSIDSRAYARAPGAHLLVVEDIGVGMPPADLAAANDLLTTPKEVDVSASRRLGFHVVSRLAERHGIEVSLTPTPGCGLTAVVILPAVLFETPSGAAGRSVVPSVLAAPRSERMTAPRPEAFSAARAASIPDPAAVPASRALPLDGRHSWPGGRDSGPVTVETGAGALRTPSHGLPSSRDDAVDAPAPVPSPAPPPEDRSPRRGLIHPIAVPPPPDASWTGDGASLEADVQTPAPPRGDGPTGARPTLSRRVPQSHLAPELSRPTADPDPPPARAPTVPTGSAGGTLDALSRYQASRRMARMEIGEGPVDPTNGAGVPRARENGARA